MEKKLQTFNIKIMASITITQIYKSRIYKNLFRLLKFLIEKISYFFPKQNKNILFT